MRVIDGEGRCPLTMLPGRISRIDELAAATMLAAASGAVLPYKALRYETSQVSGHPNPFEEVVVVTINQTHLDALCPQLRRIFDAEIAAGNRTLETRNDWPNKGGLFILLRNAFQENSAAVDPALFYTETTPRAWGAHYCHLESKQMLACGVKPTSLAENRAQIAIAPTH